MTLSLYDRVGGEGAIVAAVDLFYERVLEDEAVRHFFDGMDVPSQARKMTAFMTWAFGGPDEFKGRDLTAAHAQLVKDKGLDGSHFDRIAAHLKAVLDELGVAPDVVADVLTTVASTREQVLGRA